MHRALYILVPALAAAACTPVPQAGTATPMPRRAQPDVSDAARAPLMSMEAPPGSAGGTPDATGQWRLQESDPPRASWGMPGREDQLTFSCDRASERIVLQRRASEVPGDMRVLAIDADGVRVDYPAERTETASTPRLSTRIALDAPILDRLLIAQRMAVSAGDDRIVTAAPGESLRAVVDACRREA